jgi:hypothetical protein
MFTKLFNRNDPVEIETTEPDPLFKSWINHLRNPNSEDAYEAYMEEAHREDLHQSMRQAV